LASHEGPRSESPGQPPLVVGDLSAERVEERTVKRYAGILGQWRPIALEDDKEGDASSHSFASFAIDGRTTSLGLRALADSLEA
jgi:hypothetical protein